MSAVSQVISKQIQESVSGLASASIGSELFAVANLLETETSLRRNLADSGLTVEVRANLVKQVLGNQVSKEAVAVVELGGVEVWVFRLQSVEEEVAEHAAHGDGPIVDRERLEAATQRDGCQILRLAEAFASVTPDFLNAAALAPGRIVGKELEADQGALAPDF